MSVWVPPTLCRAEIVYALCCRSRRPQDREPAGQWRQNGLSCTRRGPRITPSLRGTPDSAADAESRVEAGKASWLETFVPAQNHPAPSLVRSRGESERASLGTHQTSRGRGDSRRERSSQSGENDSKEEDRGQRKKDGDCRQRSS